MIRRPIVFCSLSCVFGCFIGQWFYRHFDISKYCSYQYGYYNYETIIIYSILFFISIFLFLVLKKIPYLLKYTGKRYISLLFLIPFIFLLSVFRFYGHSMPSSLEKVAEQEKEGKLIGKVHKIIKTEKGNRILLKKVIFQENSKKYIQGKRGKILLYDSSEASIQIGNIIVAIVKLQNFRKATNFGQYDEYRYQKSRGNDIMAYTKQIKILDDNREKKLSYILQKLQKRLEKVYDSRLNEKEASIIKAMVLGEKDEIDKNTKRLYSRNGIAHILAISGLHISMLGVIFYKGLQLFILKIQWKKENLKIELLFLQVVFPMIAIMFVFFYGKMVGFGISVERAFIMFILSLFAIMVGRTYDLFTSVALAALLALLKEPLYIFDRSFWLSFGAVFGIAILLPTMEQIFPDSSLGEHNNISIKYIWKNILRKLIWKKGYIFIKKKIRSGLLVSISVFFSTFPVIIKTYFTYPFYAIILNLIIIPLMSILFPIALFMGIWGIFFTLPVPILTILIERIINFYETICLFIEKLPLAIQITGSPETWKIVLYYAILAYIPFLWKRFCEKGNYNSKSKESRGKEKRDDKKNIKIFQYGVLFISIILTGLMNRFHSLELEIYFLDIGQGDSIVIKLPENRAITIDGGSSSICNAGEYRLLPFLKANRITRIEYAFLTHMDQDHVNAIEELLKMEPEKKECYIKNLVVPIVLKENNSWKEMEELAKKRGVYIFYIQAGDKFNFINVTFQCLHPIKEQRINSENADSLVLKINYKKFDLLLTGDIEGEGEKTLIENYQKEIAKIDLLKVAHHGSKNSTSEKFLSICQPSISIISCGKGNRYGHPNQETLERLEDINSKVMITKDSGEIMVKTDGERIKIKEYIMK